MIVLELGTVYDDGLVQLGCLLPFFGLNGLAVCFPQLDHQLQVVLMRTNGNLVDLDARGREQTRTDQCRILIRVQTHRQQIVQICHLAEMRAERVQEQ